MGKKRPGQCRCTTGPFFMGSAPVGGAGVGRLAFYGNRFQFRFLVVLIRQAETLEKSHQRRFQILPVHAETLTALGRMRPDRFQYSPGRRVPAWRGAIECFAGRDSNRQSERGLQRGRWGLIVCSMVLNSLGGAQTTLPDFRWSMPPFMSPIRPPASVTSSAPPAMSHSDRPNSQKPS